MNKFKSNEPMIILSGFIFCVLVSLRFVSHDDYAYVWDDKMFWNQFEWICSAIDGSFFKGLATVLDGVRKDDYNPIATSLLYPAYSLFGGNRYVFVSAICSIYITATSYVIGKSACYYSRDNKNIVFLLAFISSILLTTFWRPSLHGLPDMLSGFFLSVSIYIAITTKNSKPYIKRAILMGVFLWLAFATRRWIAFSVISLYLSIFIFKLTSKEDGYDHKNQIRGTVLFSCIAGLTSIFMLIVFQHTLVMKILSTSYSSAYSAYQWGLSKSIAIFISNFGLILLPLPLVSFFYSIFKRNKEYTILSAFGIINIIVTFLFFSQTQSPSIQHLIPYGVYYLISIVPLIIYIANFKTLSFMYMLFCALTFYIPVISQKSFPLFPEKVSNFKLNNYNNYIDMISEIEHLTSDGSTFSVLGSSTKFTDDLFRTISKNKLNNRLIKTAQVDARDGLNTNFTKSNFIIVATPIQLHLNGGQEIVRVPASQILSGEGIGKFYRYTGKHYQIANGATAKIFKRIEEIPQSQVEDMLKEIKP